MMNSTTAATMFLAERRQISQSNVQRTFSTLSTVQAMGQNDSSIAVFDDAELIGAGEVKLSVNTPSYLLLLPITGDLAFIADSGKKVEIVTGQAQVFYVTSAYTLVNPFPDQVINYLQVLIVGNKPSDHELSWPFNIDLDNNENKIVTLEAVNLPFIANICRFKGRQKGEYLLKDSANSLFAYVISGAFEVEDRLLQLQDGLQLSAVKKIEFEALSEYAILFFIACPGHPLPHLGN